MKSAAESALYRWRTLSSTALPAAFESRGPLEFLVEHCCRPAVKQACRLGRSSPRNMGGATERKSLRNRAKRSPAGAIDSPALSKSALQVRPCCSESRTTSAKKGRTTLATASTVNCSRLGTCTYAHRRVEGSSHLNRLMQPRQRWHCDPGKNRGCAQFSLLAREMAGRHAQEASNGLE